MKSPKAEIMGAAERKSRSQPSMGEMMPSRARRPKTSCRQPTGRVEARGIEKVEERELGEEPGGTGAVSRKIPKSLKLSLRGSVETQDQHRPDRLSKPRTGSVADR